MSTHERVLLTVREACATVHVRKTTIYRWLKAGKLDVIRTVGGSLRIYEDSLWQKTPTEAPE